MENHKNPLVAIFGHERRWVNWKHEERDGGKTKIPYAANGRMASSTDPSTWSTYNEASQASDRVGIIFRGDKLLLGIDIDHVIKDGVLRADIQQFVDAADTYTEISPSGTGLHLYLILSEPLKLTANRHSPFEAYTEGRYFTVTGTPFGAVRQMRTISPEEALKLLGTIGYPWQALKAPETPQNALKSAGTPQVLDDKVLLQKMFSAKNGAAVRTLYDGDTTAYGLDESRADLALLSHLAFWSGRNAHQMERIWLGSSLGRRVKTQARKDYRDRTIVAAIAKCESIFTPHSKSLKGGTEDDERHKSAAEVLLRYIEGLENTLLFHDEQGEAYIAIEVSGHREVWPCKSKAVKRWLAHEYWKIEKKAAGSEAIKNVIGVLEGRATYEGPLHKLGVRSAFSEDGLWYDLTDEKWQAIKVSARGWEVVSNPPVLFRRYSHAQPQVIPIAGGDVRLLLEYINIKDPQQHLLLMVFLVSCFIPGFAHVILVVFGSQGSAKTTLAKLLRRIVDPSMIEVASMPDAPKELIQALAHHAFLFFDNVSHVSEVISDILCKAITGSGFPKRELYSDDEDIIYSFRRCIGINGINLVSTRPDLLERSLLIELDRIPDSERKQEKELTDKFDKDLPLILGGVFDALAKALPIRNTIKLTNIPRMADFAVWGCAIAQALGYSSKDFLDAYQANIGKQTEVVLNDNIVATAVVSFMEDKEEWRGTASELLHQLATHAAFQQIDTYEKYWPKASNSLMRRLNELKVNLKKIGISFTSIPGNTREVVLRKLPHTDGSDDNSSTSL